MNHVPKLVFAELLLLGEGAQALVQVDGLGLQAATALHAGVLRARFLQRRLVAQVQRGRVPFDRHVRAAAELILLAAWDHAAATEPAHNTRQSQTARRVTRPSVAAIRSVFSDRFPRCRSSTFFRVRVIVWFVQPNILLTNATRSCKTWSSERRHEKLARKISSCQS